MKFQFPERNFPTETIDIKLLRWNIELHFRNWILKKYCLFLQLKYNSSKKYNFTNYFYEKYNSFQSILYLILELLLNFFHVKLTNFKKWYKLQKLWNSTSPIKISWLKRRISNFNCIQEIKFQTIILCNSSSNLSRSTPRKFLPSSFKPSSRKRNVDPLFMPCTTISDPTEGPETVFGTSRF